MNRAAHGTLRHHHMHEVEPGHRGAESAPPTARSDTNLTWTALAATLHCLTGSAIGEVLGMATGTALGLDNLTTTFASNYKAKVDLEGMLTKDAILDYRRMSTGEKYLVLPNG